MKTINRDMLFCHNFIRFYNFANWDLFPSLDKDLRMLLENRTTWRARRIRDLAEGHLITAQLLNGTESQYLTHNMRADASQLKQRGH